MPGFIKILCSSDSTERFTTAAPRATDIPEIIYRLRISTGNSTPQTESMIFIGICFLVTLRLFPFPDLSGYMYISCPIFTYQQLRCLTISQKTLFMIKNNYSMCYHTHIIPSRIDNYSLYFYSFAEVIIRRSLRLCIEYSLYKSPACFISSLH